ncbi:MAG TPA: transglutaminase family protein, partial [Hyphomicrobiaceae bacterium]|nr:transglutaminase family protein [Hyphomicrobiaceae bacterium]
MSIHVALTHRTAYTYDRPVTMGPQIIRLRPAPHSRTPILSYSLDLLPKKHFLNWQQDPFGNFLARMVPQEPTHEFSITVDLVADMSIINPFDFFLEESAQHWPFSYSDIEKQELAPYLAHDKPSPMLQTYIDKIEKKPGQNTLDFVVELNQKLQNKVDYVIRMEAGVQTPEETLTKHSGSCRDSSWLLVEIFRNLGLAARFVSGYLIQLKPDVKALDGPSGTEVDFTDLHAWAEVYLPGAGWVGLDPTSGLLTGEGHIPLAAAPHFASAAPLSGGHTKAEVTFDFEMKITRIQETPRVTKPYTVEQWQKIDTLGAKVDDRLKADDVRLTMGGEPTFVSIDDMEGAEWTNAAVGPTKRHFAEELVRRMARRYGTGGLMHFGQGKWYPGEQLPRWAFAVYWRRDGQPLWEDETLIDKEAPSKKADIETATRFMGELCRQMGLDPDSGIPAFEDTAHFLLEEQRLPLGIDPSDNKLEDKAARARLVKTFERGLTTPVGFVLPIQSWQTKDRGRRWLTEVWQTRRERLFLIPGDSPIGFRLPLGGLPYVRELDYPHVQPRDPLSQHEPLPERAALMEQRRAVTLEQPPAASQAGTAEIIGTVRTAMAIEPRDGHLCVFMPPLDDAEDYAALVTALEESARVTKTPIRIDGYEPPSDP